MVKNLPWKQCLLPAILLSSIGNAGVIPLDNTESDGYPLVIPVVQKLEKNSECYQMPDVIRVKAPAEAEFESREICKIFHEAGRKTQVIRDGTGDIELILTEKDVPQNSEGYTLCIDSHGIRISARETAGLFYGAQSLRFIVKNTAGTQLKGCRIVDFPRMRYRGIMTNLRTLRSNEIPSFLRDMENLSRFKMNAAFLEFETNFPLKDSSYTKRRYALTEKDIQTIVDFCRKRHIEIIPMLQCWSHIHWMRVHPNFKDFLEGEDTGWNSNYCPSNPKAVKATLDLMNEHIRLLKPRNYHLGLDEIEWGGFAVCDECRKRGIRNILKEHVSELVKFVKDRGCTPWIWHDTFYPGRSIRGEEILPYLDKEIIFTYWNYLDAVSDSEAEYMTKAGFRLSGATWVPSVRNQESMARVLDKYHGVGGYLTFWESYFRPHMYDPLTPAKTFMSVMNLGNYLWNPSAPGVDKITYDSASLATRMWHPEIPAVKPGDSMKPVNLAPFVNAVRGNGKDFPQINKPEELALLKKILREQPEAFRLSVKDHFYCGILLDGNPENKFQLRLKQPTDKLALLLTASRPEQALYYDSPKGARKRPQIGNLILTLDNGETIMEKLLYSYNIIDWNTNHGCNLGRLICKGTDSQGAMYAFMSLVLTPPEGRKIAGVKLTGTPRGGITPLLLAVSANRDASAELPAGETASDTAMKKTGAKSLRSIYFSTDDLMYEPQKIKVSGGKFSAPVRHEIITDRNHNPILRVTVPALAAGMPRQRVNITLPVESNWRMRDVCFTAKANNTDGIVSSDIYIADQETEKYAYSGYKLSAQWRDFVFPFNSMNVWKATPKPRADEIQKIFFSFWLKNYDKELVFEFKNIGLRGRESDAAVFPSIDFGKILPLSKIASEPVKNVQYTSVEDDSGRSSILRIDVPRLPPEVKQQSLILDLPYKGDPRMAFFSITYRFSNIKDVESITFYVSSDFEHKQYLQSNAYVTADLLNWCKVNRSLKGMQPWKGIPRVMPENINVIRLRFKVKNHDAPLTIEVKDVGCQMTVEEPPRKDMGNSYSHDV